ncbi:MAG: hypothetical protein R3Y35_00025 [Clostridia bacterium]
MDELTEQLNKVLSDPNSMAQIQNIMNSLGVTNNQTNSKSQMQTPITTNTNPVNLGGISPEMLGAITKIAPLLNQVKTDDNSTRLLNALKPMLSNEKSKKVDEALKVLQIIKLFPALKESGILTSVLGGLF